MTRLPDDIPTDELLSAYLDGELSADQCAAVEELVAGRPDLKEMLDDFRLLRDRLTSLPRERLEADFADRVLRSAEREMLRDSAEPHPVVAGKVQEVSSVAGDANTGWRRWQRPFAWSGLAVAAALLVMFLGDRMPLEKREEPAPQQVAMAPRDLAFEAAPADVERSAGAPASDATAASGEYRSSGIDGQPGTMLALSTAPAPTLLVRCETPSGNAPAEFEQLLVSNRIQVLPAAGEESGRTDEERAGSIELHDSLARDSSGAPAKGQLGAVYVVATKRQVDATLAAMREAKGQFANMTVEPVNAPIVDNATAERLYYYAEQNFKKPQVPQLEDLAVDKSIPAVKSESGQAAGSAPGAEASSLEKDMPDQRQQLKELPAAPADAVEHKLHDEAAGRESGLAAVESQVTAEPGYALQVPEVTLGEVEALRHGGVRQQAAQQSLSLKIEKNQQFYAPVDEPATAESEAAKPADAAARGTDGAPQGRYNIPSNTTGRTRAAAPAPKADTSNPQDLKAPAQSTATSAHEESPAEGAQPPAPGAPPAVWDADADHLAVTDPDALWQHVLFVFEAEPGPEAPAAPAEPAEPSTTPPAAPSDP